MNEPLSSIETGLETSTSRGVQAGRTCRRKAGANAKWRSWSRAHPAKASWYAISDQSPTRSRSTGAPGLGYSSPVPSAMWPPSWAIRCSDIVCSSRRTTPVDDGPGVEVHERPVWLAIATQ